MKVEVHESDVEPKSARDSMLEAVTEAKTRERGVPGVEQDPKEAGVR